MHTWRWCRQRLAETLKEDSLSVRAWQLRATPRTAWRHGSGGGGCGRAGRGQAPGRVAMAHAAGQARRGQRPTGGSLCALRCSNAGTSQASPVPSARAARQGRSRTMAQQQQQRGGGAGGRVARRLPQPAGSAQGAARRVPPLRNAVVARRCGPTAGGGAEGLCPRPCGVARPEPAWGKGPPGWQLLRGSDRSSRAQQIRSGPRTQPCPRSGGQWAGGGAAVAARATLRGLCRR